MPRIASTKPRQAKEETLDLIADEPPIVAENASAAEESVAAEAVLTLAESSAAVLESPAPKKRGRKSNAEKAAIAAAEAALFTDAPAPPPAIAAQEELGRGEGHDHPFGLDDDREPFADTIVARLLAGPPPALNGAPAALETVMEAAPAPKIEPITTTDINTKIDKHTKENAMPATAEKKETALKSVQKAPGSGLTVSRRYTQPGQDVWKSVEWELRKASIVGSDGKVVFEQDGVEIPKDWSQLATNVVVSKYFRGHVGTLEREYSVKQLISRVADKIIEWGKAGKYFATEEDAATFHDELRYILLHQYAAFNSPVWFNLGWPGRRQAVSACYINEVDDTMESILDLYKTEGMLFKDGSGSGVNLSTLRSSKEPLQAGGRSSGPISFMKGLDASAGSIKSGGSTRRAACMRVLDVDHPDIEDFIDCKKDAELKAHALIDAGYSGAFNVVNGAYDTVPFQNANHSVRVSDEFMQAVAADGPWETKARLTGKPISTVKARDLMRGIAQGTWVCGDPGMQYDTTINDWHTCSNTDRIYASNPCSEYMFLNSTACNLSSLNLMKFRQEGTGAFDTESFEHAVRIMITAQEIVVGFAAYPTEKIEERSHVYRTLGLGYANLGALLMASGLPYDSDAGRAYAGAVTAIMTGRAYEQSAKIARDCGGPFSGYAENREPMLRVMRKHRAAVADINPRYIPETLAAAAQRSWDEALEIGEQYGYRNAQATVLAPTGTIGFLMDCDTTGIEPDIAIVKYKSLVGGGAMKIVNQTVPEALTRLGYTDDQMKSIIAFIDEHDTIEGAPALKTDHLPIFDCAFRASNGTRSIHYKGHIKMMAAAQPFISGAISKTVNVPTDATPEEIAETYIESWQLGLKAVAIYRDGSKRTQPLNTSKEKPAGEKASVSTLSVSPETKTYAMRRRLPDERASVTHKFSIGGHEGYITVGLYPDTGDPGEIFIRMAKEGSSISGLMDSFATAISLSLQYGVPLSTLVDKFIHSRFEPSGFTNNKDIPMAKSVMDYIFRWLALKFLEKNQRHNVGLLADQEPEPEVAAPAAKNGNGSNGNGAHGVIKLPVNDSPATIADHERETFRSQSDAPPCPECGAITIRSGACYKCMQCGTSLGCS
jgi:ribonucleoside-diphosphate reductase alpha chain